MPQVVVNFGNIQGVRGFSFTLSRGVTPSAFCLYMLPQDNFDPGVQTLTYGVDSNTCSLSGCIMGPAFVRKHWDNKWPLWAAYGFDRRWKWRFSTVSGDYNRRKPDGTIDGSTQVSCAYLIGTVLAQALGETIDVSRVPASVFPRCKWQNQRADLALQQLCDSIACDVVMNPVNDSVEIWPLGSGQTAPTGTSEVLPKYRYFPRSNIPSSVEVHGGDSLYQHRLKMQAVAIDTDGKQKKLADITSVTWSTESPFSFPSTTDTTTRSRYFDEVHREFRVIGQADGTVQVPGCPASVTKIDQYLLNTFRLDYETDVELFTRKLDYYIDGDYWAYTDLPNNTSSMIYTGTSTLNTERRVVKLPYPLFKISSTGAIDYAVLYLTTSYRVQDGDRNIVHVARSGNVGGSGGKLIVKRPEVFATYTSSSNTAAQANAELDAYVSLFQQKYANPQAAEITYGGFFRGSLDGVIAQARWDILPTYVTTTVGENFEPDIHSLGQDERSRRLLLSWLDEQIKTKTTP